MLNTLKGILSFVAMALFIKAAYALLGLVWGAVFVAGTFVIIWMIFRILKNKSTTNTNTDNDNDNDNDHNS